MNKKLCVYTCITGNYDQIHEINVIEDGVDYYCFTNNKEVHSKTWKVVYIKNDGLTDHQLSRKIKMLGHPLISKNYDTSLWMDASVVWTESIKEFVKKYLKNEAFAAFKHCARTSIQAEAAACCILRKDSKDKIEKTLALLKKEGFPDNIGLHEMTVFIKRHNDPVVKKTMALWFRINCKYSKRDQLSFEYAVWKNQLKINTINLNVWNNKYFYHFAHNNNHTIDTCTIYFGDSSSNFSFNKFRTYVYSKEYHTHSVKCKIPINTNTIEIYPSEAIGIIYNNIRFMPSPKSQVLPEAFLHNDGYVPYDANVLFRYEGDFRAGEELVFSFDARLLNRTELFNLFYNFWNKTKCLSVYNEKIHSLESELEKTRQLAESLKNDLSLIYNSKSYRYTRRISKLVNKIKKVILLN